MTDDKQDQDSDVTAESHEAGSRAAGIVYLVPDRQPADDDSMDSGLPDPESSAGDDAVAAQADDATDGSEGPVGQGGRTATGEDWPWVVEWRAGGEPTPWATGLALTLFSALVVGVAVWVLSAGLADRPIVAVLVNLLVAGGLAPAMWLSKDLPVLRWIAGGALIGIVGGWIAALMMLPMPTV